MNITIHNEKIAELISENIEIKEIQDALDVMANSRYYGAGSLIIHEHQIIPEFFDLRTGIAGEILQKFSNYRMKLAIVGDFSRFQSKSLHDFIRESNKRGTICFVSTTEEAKAVLLK
jgi:hypothetical protein